MNMVTFEMIERAATRIAPHVRRTPLEYSYELSRLAGADVFLKLECLQVTGSFKPRISLNKLLTVDARLRRRGAIASTAGGHGIGLAYAAERLGIPADVFLPRTADPRKIEVLERLGARLRFFDTVTQAREAAVAEADDRGLVLVSAYNDPEIVAGGGTVGLEILQDQRDVDLVLVGMGGGGLASGSAIALKTANPKARVWGVQPVNNPVLATWLREGHPVVVPQTPSIADGLGADIETDSITFPLALETVDRTVLVTEEEIKDAMAWALEKHQLVVEPSGAAPIAAFMKSAADGLPPFRSAVIIVTGRNVSRTRYVDLLGDRLSSVA